MMMQSSTYTKTISPYYPLFCSQQEAIFEKDVLVSHEGPVLRIRDSTKCIRELLSAMHKNDDQLIFARPVVTCKR
jgi:hypothetical protein